MQNDRYTRGLEILNKLDPKADERLRSSLNDIAPDFERYVVEFGFGDLYSRPGLDAKSRQIAIIAALTSLGTAVPQLKLHIDIGLNVGLTREQIVEVIMQMAVYAGMPAVLNGLVAAKETFAQHGSQS